MIFGIGLILIVGGLFVFCLTESKGRHSVHARQSELTDRDSFPEMVAALEREAA